MQELELTDHLRPKAQLAAIAVLCCGAGAQLFNDPNAQWYVRVTHDLFREERISLMPGDVAMPAFRRICHEVDERERGTVRPTAGEGPAAS